LDAIMGVKDEAERFKYMYYYFGGQKIIWFRNHGWEENAKDLEESLSEHDTIDRLYTRNENGKIHGIFPGMIKPAIPQWFWTWFDGHDLEHRIIADNRRWHVEAIKFFMNKSENDE